MKELWERLWREMPTTVKVAAGISLSIGLVISGLVIMVLWKYITT